jgi:ABC-type bacteriocin/lantibiotic exporter with double-glycine peptidase domain
MRFATLWQIAFLCLAAVTCPAADSNPSSLPTSEAATYRNILKCGPNALYLFLRWSGCQEVPLTRLDQLPISSSGTSLLVLRDAAKALGVRSEVRRYRAEELDALPLPAIAQLYEGHVGVVTRYHYGVIYKVDARRLYYVDATTGAKGYIDRAPDMFYWWTGVAMVPAQSRWGSLSTALSNSSRLAKLICISLAAADAIILISWIRRRKKPIAREIDHRTEECLI